MLDDKRKSFFFILIASLVIIPILFGSASAERGSNYIDVTNPDRTHTWQSAPEWILDNGIYKPYKLFQDANIVRVETMQGSFVFDKTLCGISFYNPGVIGGQQPIIRLDNYTVLGTTVGNQNFMKVDSINNAACQASVVQSGNDIEVWGTKHVDNVGTFIIKYIKRDGRQLKTQLEPTNENPIWINHKIGITQTLGVPNIITLGDTQYDLRNFNNTVLDRSWLVAHKAQLLQLSNLINFDFSIGFQYVEKVTIWYDGISSYLIIDYWNNTPQILPGQTLVIDPTISLTVTTSKAIETTSSVSGSCPTTANISIAEFRIHVGQNTPADICRFASEQFDVTSVPNLATIQNVTVTISPSGVATPRVCQATPMTVNTITATNQQILDDIKDGTPYFTGWSGCTTASTSTIGMGSSAIADLQSTIAGDDLFTFGFQYDDMSRDASPHATTDTTDDTSITITYILPLGAVTDLVALQITGSAVILDWSEPSLGGDTLLGYQINFTTPWGNPLSIITNNTGSSQSTGTVSGLTGETKYSFRVSAWTNSGNNATGNILNITTLRDFSIGNINLTATNPDIIPIMFDRNDINDTALFLNVTYSNTFHLACDFHYKFAQTNNTYTNLSNITVGGNRVRSDFQFVGVDNEIIDVFCWNDNVGGMNNTNVNSTNSGRYLITQTTFPLLKQIQNFTSGVYGTSGQFGVINLVTLVAIIMSMVGLNRVNESVGGIFVVSVVGVLWYFEIIDILNFIGAAIALTVMLIIGTTKKD